MRKPGKLVPVTDVRAARSALRGIQERWEQAGPVPREAHERLESGLRRIEDAVRKAEDAQWRRSNPEALARARGTVEQIRSAITGLEDQLAKAEEAGNPRAVQEAQEALDARRCLARGSRKDSSRANGVNRGWLGARPTLTPLPEYGVSVTAKAAALARDAVDVVDAVDGAHGTQHVARDAWDRPSRR